MRCVIARVWALAVGALVVTSCASDGALSAVTPSAAPLQSALAGRHFDLVSMNGIAGAPASWFEVAADDSVTMRTDCLNDAKGEIRYHGDGSISAGAHLEIVMQTAMACTTPTVYPLPVGELVVEGVSGDGRVLVSIDSGAGVRLYALSTS